MKKLPKKLSACVKLALEDLAKVERSKKYQIEMGEWHTPAGAYYNKCAVCFAGSVMAKSLGCAIDKEYDPGHFSEETQERLLVLDTLRGGDVTYALEQLGVFTGDYITVDIPRYGDDPQGFKLGMKKIAKILEALGQ